MDSPKGLFFKSATVVPVNNDWRTTEVRLPRMTEELVPILHVKDGQATARWYSRLGFEVEGEHRFAPEMPLYLFLRRGNDALHLSEHKGDARPGTLMYFYVHDVDSIAREFKVEVHDQPWAREVQLADPDGNRLRIGERRNSCNGRKSAEGGDRTHTELALHRILRASLSIIRIDVFPFSSSHSVR